MQAIKINLLIEFLKANDSSLNDLIKKYSHIKKFSETVIMNSKNILIEEIKNLPEPMVAEVLDFIAIFKA